MRRRDALGAMSSIAAAASMGWVGRPAGAAEVEMLPTIPLTRHVVRADGTYVVDTAFIELELATANDLFKDAGIVFEFGSTIDTDGAHKALETRADRDKLADYRVANEVNVFFVDSLRDVDDPKLHRMGVTWRKLSDLKAKYIIVAASGSPTTLAHELGHFFGLDHVGQKNNLMSYDRDGGAVFLTDPQRRVIRSTATKLLAQKSIVPRATT